MLRSSRSEPRWAALLPLLHCTALALSILAGCSPAATLEPTTLTQPLQNVRGRPIDRLVAPSALPSARLLNPEVILSGRGGALLVSNDPEYLAEPAALPRALYRDEVSGSFRVFYHHTNHTRTDLTFATAVTNTHTRPVLLFGRGSGQGTNLYPDIAGQVALNGYLRTRYQTARLARLAPGESIFVTPHTAGPNDTASALEEFIALTPSSGRAAHANRSTFSARFSPATVTLTVLAYRGAAPRAPQSLSVLPGSPLERVDKTPYYLLKRGTFPFFDRYAEVALSPDTATKLVVDSAVFGPFSRAIRGEYLLGRDAVSGEWGYNNGNYGVLYNFRLRARNDALLGLSYALLMQPSGGFGHYAVQTQGDVVTSAFISYKNAWWFYRALILGPGGSLTLRAGLTGGSFGPQKFFFVPYRRFE